MPPAARITDPVAHPLPPVLTGGPTAVTVIIEFLPAWRGIGAGGAASLQAAKKASEIKIQTAEAATLAAAGTPGAPAAKAAEETLKAAEAAAVGAAIPARRQAPTFTFARRPCRFRRTVRESSLTRQKR